MGGCEGLSGFQVDTRQRPEYGNCGEIGVGLGGASRAILVGGDRVVGFRHRVLDGIGLQLVASGGVVRREAEKAQTQEDVPESV